MQKPPELARLLELVGTPSKVIEVGTFAGGTLWAWCQVAADDATIVSIDLPGGAGGGGYTEAQQRVFETYAKPGQTLHFIRADSHLTETVDEVEELVEDVDVLFLDGDHSYAGVHRDYLLYQPFVKPGGLVAFHDIEEPDVAVTRGTVCEVHVFWRELRAQWADQGLGFHEFVDTFGDPRRWGGIGVLEMP